MCSKTIFSSGKYQVRTWIEHAVTYGSEAMSPGGQQTSQRVREVVPRAEFERIRMGDPVALRYLPEAPWRVEFEPGATGIAGGALIWLAWGALAIAALVGRAAWRPARRASRLAAIGLRARGRVERMWLGETSVSFRVRFTDAANTDAAGTDAAGTDAAGTERCVAPPSVSAKRWSGVRVGSTVDLLYDSDDLSNVRLE